MAGDCTQCGGARDSAVHQPSETCTDCSRPQEHHAFVGAGVAKENAEFMTVTLVVEYDGSKTPDDWDWDTLIDGRARVLHAWPTEADELAQTFTPDPASEYVPFSGNHAIMVMPDGTVFDPVADVRREVKSD